MVSGLVATLLAFLSKDANCFRQKQMPRTQEEISLFNAGLTYPSCWFWYSQLYILQILDLKNKH